LSQKKEIEIKKRRRRRKRRRLLVVKPTSKILENINWKKSSLWWLLMTQNKYINMIKFMIKLIITRDKQHWWFWRDISVIYCA